MNESPAIEPIEPAQAPPPPVHPYRAFAFRAGLGFAVVAFLLWHFDARPVLRVLAREKLGHFAATVALYVASQVMSSYRWSLLAGLLQVRGRYSEFLAYYFVGTFTNLFVPGLVGGDAARAIYLGRRHDRMGEAVASVIADRGIGLVALFWFAAAVAIFLNRSALPPSVIRPTIAVGAVAMLGYLAAPYLVRLTRYAPARLRAAAEVATPYLLHPQSLIPAIVLSVLLQASLAVCQWLLACGLGLETPLSLFLLCVPIANVFASVPLTLNGLGIRETAYLVLFGMAGVARQDAIALGLLWFAATILGGLVGGIAFVRTPMPVLVAAKSKR
ncbi:MAG TPA: lysylphosphatidylglycerol synthase transmembrane domain-containing protein [Candidatus Binataceae bacterium]|nr:lysylphosphatidylglycerol synthase transmembrane domain-containing protein [Candidatus Binataceae bacterium]